MKCHVYGYAGWVGEITFTHLNTLPLKPLSYPWLFSEGKPMDCTEEILVFFGISLVL